MLRDLALRRKLKGANARFALLEKDHFASGTSGRNSHLIHGGLRYLKYFDFSLVREALHERSVLLNIAPHMVEPLPFVLPFENAASRLFYSAGLTLYDKLAGSQNIAKHRRLQRDEFTKLEPEVSANFSSASEFWDGRVDSARLVLENVLEAVENDALAANYVEVLDWKKSDGEFRIEARDRLGGAEFTIRAKRLVNGLGAWSHDPRVRLVRGSHIVLPRLNRSGHAIAWFEPAGRIVFFIPWGSLRQFTLVGTTDVDHDGPPGEARISPEEVQYLLNAARRVFGDQVGEPVGSFSSVRPLVFEKGRSATATSRTHRIWADTDGIVHITGGKYTTFRLMSKQAADLAYPEWAGMDPTRTTPLRGNSRSAIAQLRADAAAIAKKYRVGDEEVMSFIRAYGIRLTDVLSLIETEAEGAAVIHAVRHEFACRLIDVLTVSTTWGFEKPWRRSELADYARLMARELHWDSTQIQVEAEHAEEVLQLQRGVPA